MLATKLTTAQAEHVRRSQRCPACGGSLFVQADPETDFATGDLVCLSCSRVAARVELKKVERRPLPDTPRRGRPTMYRGTTPCKAGCGKALTSDQERARGLYCSPACSNLHKPRGCGATDAPRSTTRGADGRFV